MGYAQAIATTAALTLWSFIGLESATVPADDVEDPRRTIPRATLFGTLAAAALYILSITAVQGLMPPEVLARSPRHRHPLACRLHSFMHSTV